MSEQENVILTAAKKKMGEYLVWAIGFFLMAGIAFYYGTMAKQDEQDKSISDLKTELQATQAAQSQMVSRNEINEFKLSVREEIRSLHDDIKEVRDDNKKILEILSEQQR